MQSLQKFNNLTEQSMVLPNTSASLEITLLNSILTPKHKPKTFWVLRLKKKHKKVASFKILRKRLENKVSAMSKIRLE